jgi:Domain of unknown function (DUF4189)
MRRTLLSLAVLMAVLAAPACALAAYAAIAVNPKTLAYGDSSRQPTQAAAVRVALRNCRGNCFIKAGANNYCAAVVVTGKKFWSGFGPNHDAAIRAARRNAQAPSAKLLTWVCSG